MSFAGENNTEHYPKLAIFVGGLGKLLLIL
jgi:hypothetical protein